MAAKCLWDARKMRKQCFQSAVFKITSNKVKLLKMSIMGVTGHSVGQNGLQSSQSIVESCEFTCGEIEWNNYLTI